MVAVHLTAVQSRLLRIAVNRLAEKGRCDIGELKLEIQELVIEDAPIELTEFSAIAIDQILIEEVPSGSETGPLAPDPHLEPIAKLGDIFVLGPHRIACGDARDADLLARLLGTEPVRLVLTDVPYNVPV